jgi:hypothetical protein
VGFLKEHRLVLFETRLEVSSFARDFDGRIWAGRFDMGITCFASAFATMEKASMQTL